MATGIFVLLVLMIATSSDPVYKIDLRGKDHLLRIRGGHLSGTGCGMYVTRADFERAGVKYDEYSDHQDWGAVWRSRKYGDESLQISQINLSQPDIHG
jgi:hypothetical protein